MNSNLIVLAEDSKTQASKTKFLLEAKGYDVEVGENGKIAYELIRKKIPKLVITDVVMPIMNGYELCRTIKGDPELSQVPVLLLTSLDSPEDVKNGLISGADDFLPKPIDEDLLFDHVDKMVHHITYGIKNKLISEISNEKVLNFLMSTYETVLIKARELEKAKNELSVLNLMLEKKVEERTALLKQRIKELNCLHEINGLYESIDFSSKELVNQTIFILKKSFINPDKVEIKIEMNGESHQTNNFDPDYQFLLSSPIKSVRSVIGTISVSYNAETNKTPFTDEEKRLIDSVAQRMYELYELGKKEEEIITLNKNLERKVKERTRQLEEANKEIESFSHSISHDLRAPLRVITGYSDILVKDFRKELSEEATILVDSISKNTQKLNQFIKDILNYSRAARKELVLSEVAMYDLFKNTFNDLTSFTEIRKIEFDLSSDLPVLEVDRVLMHLVVQNLLSNAIKYSSKKEVIKIKVDYEKTVEGHLFSVEDNGAGFDMRYKEKLFGFFQRLHKESEFPGSGVGLAITARIIIKHKGKIWAESEIGEGARFYFLLPKIII